MKTFEEILTEECAKAWPEVKEYGLEWLFDVIPFKAVYDSMKRAHDQAVDLCLSKVEGVHVVSPYDVGEFVSAAHEEDLEKVKDML